jgi:hypothetical protein
MKTRLIFSFLMVIITLFSVGCSSLYYNNSALVVNSANTDSDGELNIFVNGHYYDTIYNSSKPEFAQRDATAVKIRSGFSNVSVGWNYDIQAIGKKNGKTVAAHFPFYAVSYGGNHQTWIITDQQLQPYSP